MKKLVFILASIFFYHCSYTQTVQVSMGASGVTEYFSDSKYDVTDGSTINVGVIGTSGVGNGTDCYIVKLDAAKQIVWQKTISNAGDDYITRVIRCSNGDYVGVGQLVRSGKTRGYVCRISSAGVLLWSVSSQNTGSANGDFFSQAYELSSGNIAVVGATNIGGGTANGLIVMLNSAGTQQWGRTVNYSSTDEMLTVNQLPSGNLIVAGTLYISSRYKAFIVEMNPTTAAIISQNEYHIATSVSGINTNINTIWPLTSFVTGGNFYMVAVNCTGFTPNVNNPVSVNVYNPSTKAVTCNLFYHTGLATASGMFASVNAANDYLVSMSYGTTQSFVSRFTSGSVSYSRKVDNNSIGIIHRTSINGSSLYLAGQTQNNNAYVGYSTVSFPLSTTPCNITTASTLQTTAPSISRTNNSTGFLTANSVMTSAAVSLINTSGVVTNVCGLIPCVQKIVLETY